MGKDPKIYVDHMLEAITNIEQDIEGHSFDSFQIDRRAKQLVERNLEIISEASRRVPEHLKASETGIEWKAIAGIGNVLRHDYHDSQPSILWATCQKELAPLKGALLRILKTLD